jgi:hypothetical protein
MLDAAYCSSDQLRQMGENGRARVLELHHPARQTQKLMSLLQNATN